MEKYLHPGMLPTRTLGVCDNYNMGAHREMQHLPPVPFGDFHNDAALQHSSYHGSRIELKPDLFSPPPIEQTFLPVSPFMSPILASNMLSPVHQPLSTLREQPASNLSHQSSYLDRLYSNPMFKDLQKLLAQECLHMQVPTNLINHTWSASAAQLYNKDADVFSCHMKLQEKFLKLRSNDKFRSQGLHMESEYSSGVGKIEVARYQALCAAGACSSQKNTVNMHFDEKRMNLIAKYKTELDKLVQEETMLTGSHPIQDKSYHLNSSTYHQNETRKCKTGVARQLDFPNEDIRSNEFCIDHMQDEYGSAASSPECLEVDISEDSLPDQHSEVSSTEHSKVNLCDSGVCADDSCSPTVENSFSLAEEGREEGRSLLLHTSYFSDNKENEVIMPLDCHPQTSNSAQSAANVGSVESSNSMQTKEEVRVRGRSRQLTAGQTDVLTVWYMEHIRYPYPSDLEVQQLSEVTGLKPQQIKKWMANKRVRNYNTLSISGNQHPIKFKFKGNRVCDVVKNTNKPNYQQLNPESRKILNEWYDEHSDHPYPSDEQKKQLAENAGISETQVKSWFANKRSRAQNTKRQVPNYFIKRYPEYASHVQMVSIGREIARKAKRQNYESMKSMSGIYMY